MSAQLVTIAHLDSSGAGRTGDVVVPFALPGEIWETEPDGERVARLVEASPARVTPSCPYFTKCGSCTLQHASPSLLANWKTGKIAEALAARNIETEIRPILTSPPKSRRRAVLTGRRTRKTVILGFNSWRKDDLVDLHTCDVLSPEIMEAYPLLRDLVRLGTSRSSRVRLTVICGPAGLDVAIDDARAIDGALQNHLAAKTSNSAIARLSWNGDLIALHRPPVQHFADIPVIPPPGAFLQATHAGETALITAVREIADGARRVVDLYCGCGTLSLPLARDMDLHCVEGNHAALDALQEAWRKTRGLKALRAESRDLARRPLLEDELAGFDLAIIDPPRAGAEAQMKHIAGSKLSRIAAISCNPITFARDVAILLDAGFRLDWVQPIDQFLWSGHVELAASLSR